MARRVLNNVGYRKELRAQLGCGPFYPGTTVTLRMETAEQQLTNPDPCEKKRECRSRTFWVGIQFHGHVKQDHVGLRKPPISLPQSYSRLKRKCVEVCGNEGDFPSALPHFLDAGGAGSSCIAYARPVVVEFSYPSGPEEHIDAEYTIELPSSMVPTFPGALFRYQYTLSLSVCEDPLDSSDRVNNYHFPVHVQWCPESGNAGRGNDGLILDVPKIAKSQGLRYKTAIRILDRSVYPSRQLAPRDPHRSGPEFLFNVRFEMNNAPHFKIAHGDMPVATLVSNGTMPACPLKFVHFDFSFNHNHYLCHQICAGLQRIETERQTSDSDVVGAPVSITTTVEQFHDLTKNKGNVSFNFQIPSYAMTFSTDVLKVEWRVIFELCLVKQGVALLTENIENLEWALPMNVIPDHSKSSAQRVDDTWDAKNLSVDGAQDT